MKNLFSFAGILLCCCCCFNASAQKIHITDTSNYWLYKQEHPGHYYNTVTYEEIKYKETLVTLNGHTYYQTEGYYSYLIREEGNKIFVKGLNREFTIATWITDTTNEFLFFDYDLQVNDTLTLPIVDYYDADAPYSKHVIRNIDSTLINNTWHKIFLIEPVLNFHAYNYYFIEGIGTGNWGPLLISNYVIPDQFSPHVICFKNNGTNPLSDYSDCAHVTAIDDPQIKHYFHFYPNPANEEITIEYSGVKNSEYNIALLDLSGRVLLKKPFRSKTTLDISNFLSGMYIIQIAGENGTLFRYKIIVRR